MLLKVASEIAPTASRELDRTAPPVMMTVTVPWVASSVAVVSELVTMASPGRWASARATAAAVVPPPMATE